MAAPQRHRTSGIESSAQDIINPTFDADLPAEANHFFTTADGDVSVVTSSGSTRVVPCKAYVPVFLRVSSVNTSGTTLTANQIFCLMP